jgi:hypothetical protein
MKSLHSITSGSIDLSSQMVDSPGEPRALRDPGKWSHKLKNPHERFKQLSGMRHLTLKAAGAALGITGERTGQLFSFYGVMR